MLLFALEMGLKAFYMSTRAFFASPWHVAQLVLLALNAAFVIVQAVSAAPTAPAHMLLPSSSLKR